MPSSSTILILAATALGVIACVQPAPRLNYGPGEACPIAPPTPAMADTLITDAEDGKNQIAVHDGRDGFLYVYADKASDIFQAPQARWPQAFPIAGGSGGSRCAFNLRGKLAARRIAFAGLGVNLKEPVAPYDASRFAGITFLARRSTASSDRVSVKFQDWNTQPPICTECFNNFHRDILLTERWTRYTIPFASLAQHPGWGSPRPPHVDAARLYGMSFEVTTDGEPFDIWIDDLAFVEEVPPAGEAAPPGGTAPAAGATSP